MSDAAIVCIVTGVVTLVTLWLKLHYGVEKKIDDNTEITKAGTTASERTAASTAQAATAVKSVVASTQSINSKLNGGIDAAIIHAVEPIRMALATHMAQDARDIADIKAELKGHSDRSLLQETNILNAINVQSLSVETLAAEMKELRAKLTETK